MLPTPQTTPAEPQPAPQSLDPTDWPTFRAQAHRMLDDILTHTQTIRDRPLWQPIPADLRPRFTTALPALPTALEHVHTEFLQQILPYALGNAHPGFMGWVHGGGTPVGILADMLAAGLNANLGGRDHAPIELERQLTEWMRTLFGFPTGASGLCVTGTSMANLLAVIIARDRATRLEAHPTAQRLRCYASTAAHSSIAKALHIAGLGPEALCSIAVNPQGQIDLEALTCAIEADRRAGLTPFLVIGSAGTVDLGAIDDLSALAGLCRRESLWFHIDGAIGALAMLAPELAPRLTGIERADSLAFDFHKWAQVPYAAGFLLVRDARHHRQAFTPAAHSAPYLQPETRGMAAGTPWPCELGIDLSRGFTALKVWFTFKVFGAEALGAVITQTCALARYLAERIAQTPELELFAAPTLNIVCFGYRAAQSDRINRQIAIELQELGAVAPSTTTLQGRTCLRAAIVNHRTTCAEIDTLLTQTLIVGRAQSSAATQQPIAGASPLMHQRTLARLALSAVEARLEQEPNSTELLFSHAMLLEQTGQPELAQQRYRQLLELAPNHIGALNNLANMLVTQGQRRQARPLYLRAVEADPTHLASRANLGNTLIQLGEIQASAEHYQAALAVSPDYRPAHAGLSFALAAQDPEAATRHRHRAFADRCVVISAYRGEAKPITVLELVSTTGGNFHTDCFLSPRVFQRILVTTEFFTPATVLPPHDLIVNAIGEADSAQSALTGALSVLAHTGAPVINHPRAVLRTGRCEIATRLAAIPNVLTARTVLLERTDLESPNAPHLFSNHNLTFPILLRSPGFHGGDHFVRIDQPSDLPTALATLPGGELLAIQYLDARASDGLSRKYRVMMIDGRLYPLHVAISPHWKIHYFSADMADNPEHRAEDAAFLNDMPSILGPSAMQALQNIQALLGLDYGGIDFGLDRQGRLLIFEANATMAVVVPDKDPRWDYRRPAIERIHIAVWEMLRRRARTSPAEASHASAA